MKRTVAFCALALGLSACGGGNPFAEEETTTGETDGGITIPASLAGDLDGFTFSPEDGGTLTVEGVFLDEDALNSIYVRKPNLDVPGYIAFAAQDDPLDQHATAYIQSLNGTRAGVVVTGGQFGTFNGGAAYARDGEFDRPELNEDTGQVSYAGSYIGLTNIDSDGNDLLPVPAGTADELLPGQSATVTGDIFINVDFSDNTLKGSIFNRSLDVDDDQLANGSFLQVGSLELDPAIISDDGTFLGDVVLEGDPTRQDRGDYGGIFGGVDSEAVAGAIFIEDHLLEDTNVEQEYGIFVLGRCGGDLESAGICAIVDG